MPQPRRVAGVPGAAGAGGVADRQRAFVALGANLLAPDLHIQRSVMEMSCISGTAVLRSSACYRSPALSGPSQPDYCNAVVELETGLAPAGLLRQLHGLEAAHGRRRGLHWASRTLDIDLLMYGVLVMSGDVLTLPHPAVAERPFVLQPWHELAPDLVLPDGRSLSRLAAEQPPLPRWSA